MKMTREEAQKKYNEIQKRIYDLDAQERTMKRSEPQDVKASAPVSREEALKRYQEIQNRMGELNAQEEEIKHAPSPEAAQEEENHPWQAHVKEAMQSPSAFNAGLMDTLSYIPRKIASSLGYNVPSASEIRESVHKPVTKTGKIADTGMELLGEVGGMAATGSGILNTAARGAKYTGALGQRGVDVAKKIADYGLGTIPATGSQAARLAKYSTAGAASSAGLQHLADWDPLAANLAMPSVLLSKAAGSKIAPFFQSPSTAAAKSLKSALGDESTKNILKELDTPKSHAFPKGYKPSAAEYSQDPTLIALERAHYATNPGAINQSADNMALLHDSVNSLAPKKASFAHTLDHASNAKDAQQSMFENALSKGELQRAQHVADIKAPEHVSHQAYGEGLQQNLGKTVSQHEKARSKASKPLYDLVAKSNTMVDVQPTYDAIKQFSEEGLQGASKSDMHAINTALKSQTEKGINPEIKSLMESLKKENANPEMVATIMEQAGIHPSKASAQQIHHVMKSIVDPAMTKAAKMQDWGRYRNLQYVKESLHDALDVVPEFAAAQKTYREMSKPINEILRDPGLAPILKTDVYNTAHKTRGASHLDKFIYGKSSEENASALMKAFSKDKKSAQQMRDYVRHEFVSDVVNPTTGEIDIKKIAQWRKSNQGAFKVDPELSQYAKNLESSQIALHELEKGHKVSTQQSKSVFDALLGRDAPIVVKGIMGSPNSTKLMKNVIKLAEEDKTGKSLNGLKKGVAEFLSDQISLAAQTTKGDYNLSFNTLRSTIDRSAAPLKDLYGPEGWKKINEVFNVLKSRNRIMSAGAAIGSPTESYQQMVGLLSDSLESALINLIPSQLGRNAGKVVSNFYKGKKKTEVLKLLSSPEAFKEAMGRTSVKKYTGSKNVLPLKEAGRSSLLSFLNAGSSLKD